MLGLKLNHVSKRGYWDLSKGCTMAIYIYMYIYIERERDDILYGQINCDSNLMGSTIY